MKTEILVEMTTLKIYRIYPEKNRDIPDDFLEILNEEIENLKNSNSSFSCIVVDAISNQYEKLIVFQK